MEALGLEASMITYSGMLSGLARNRQLTEIERVIEAMKKRNMVPNAWALGDLINRMSDTMPIDQAFNVRTRQPPRSALVAQYSQHDTHDTTQHTRHTTHTAHDTRHDTQMAQALVQKKVEANADVWHALLRVCAKADDVEKGIKILDMMRSHSPELVNASSYCVLIDTFAKAGRVSRVRTTRHDTTRHAHNTNTTRTSCMDSHCVPGSSTVGAHAEAQDQTGRLHLQRTTFIITVIVVVIIRN
jgi:pentatricopeptide repeat protein